jgi:energy-coupling factor transport system permease protein
MKTSWLDPRTKLVLALTAAVVLVSIDQWPVLLVTTVLIWGVTLPLNLMTPWLKFFRGLGPAVFGFFAIAWLALDLSTALVSGLRLLALGTVFFLFFQTTSPKALSKALLQMKLPYAFSFVLTVSMEFIPVLTRRAANIRDAQRARGIPVGLGWRGLRYLPALLGPLLIQAFKLADEMAEALEARGFGAASRRHRQELRLRPLDWGIILLSLIGLAVLLFVKYI